MSMLAEPRRKQRIFNLRAKNNAWSSDADKFGQKMLEKMGWSAGKGLGAKEDGMVEHVLARYKNDSAGLGFEDKNDQWTKNEQDFEGLLRSLGGVGDTNDGDARQIVSLEEKSKRSRARIHYHKFTRGKDLSKYSEKDLANIFGKKTLTEKVKIVEKVTPVEEKSAITGQLFTTKGTLVDYFKQMKSKDVTPSDLNGDLDNSHGFNDNLGFSFKGFSQTNSANITEKEINQSQDLIKNKKSKNAYKRNHFIEHCTSAIDVADNFVLKDILQTKKKKIKTKTNQDHSESLQIVCDDIASSNKYIDSTNSFEIDPVPSKKKKKSKRNKDILNNMCNAHECPADDLVHTVALIKHNKRKKSKHTLSVTVQSLQNEANSGKVNETKKNKSTPIINPLNEESNVLKNVAESSHIISKKAKKRKNKDKKNRISVKNVEKLIPDEVIQKNVRHKQPRKLEINLDFVPPVLEKTRKKVNKEKKND